MNFNLYKCVSIPVEQNCCVDIIAWEIVGHAIRVVFMHRASTKKCATRPYSVDINAWKNIHAQVDVHCVPRPVLTSAHMVNVERPLASFHVSLVIINVDGGAST